MYCPKCGKKLVEDAKFCYVCGAEIVIPEPDEDNNTPVNDMPQRKQHDETDPFDMWDEAVRERTIKKGNKKKREEKGGCGTAILVTIITVAVFCIITYLGNKYIISGSGSYNSSISSYSGDGNNSIYGSSSYSISSYGSSGSKSSESKRPSNRAVTCSMCGKSWEPSDSSGNYMKIVMSSMCKSCYNNYKQMEVYRDALGN